MNGKSGEVIDVSTLLAGRYRMDARLGGGGMADVFEAYDEILDRTVAVKILRGIDDAGAARRFAEEIRLTARVNHPNIVSLFDAGEHDGSPYLVLERVTGGTLAGEMAAGPLDPRRVAEMGEQLASALSHSHAAGIVHRDVKPTNVLLTGDGDVRLADFGIAITATATRLTVAGTVAGSAGYVSPEQVLGTGAGAASDIYSLGLVLLECLTGNPPWSGTTVEVALARLTADPPIPDTLPAGWLALLRGMTARNPEDRPSIDLVGLALSQLAQGEAPDDRLFALPADSKHDRRIPAVAGMSMLLLLFSAVLVLSTSAPITTVANAGALTTAGMRMSPLAAEHAALTPAAAVSTVAEKETRSTRRRAAPRRTRDRDAAHSVAGRRTAPRSVAGSGVNVAGPLKQTQDTSGADDGPSIAQQFEDAFGDFRLDTSTTSGTGVTDPTTVVKDPVVLDPIDTVKEAAQRLNKGKGSGKPDDPKDRRGPSKGK
jgi:hypothetical protein